MGQAAGKQQDQRRTQASQPNRQAKQAKRQDMHETTDKQGSGVLEGQETAACARENVHNRE